MRLGENAPRPAGGGGNLPSICPPQLRPGVGDMRGRGGCRLAMGAVFVGSVPHVGLFFFIHEDAAAGVGRAAAAWRGAGRRRGTRFGAGTGSNFAGSARYSRKIRAMDAAW